MNELLLHAWVIYKVKGRYFLPYSHWAYLREIVKHYDVVCLMSPVIEVDDEEGEEYLSYLAIDCFENVTVYVLPPSSSYLGAVRYFGSYVKAYSRLKNSTVSYVRYPVPFGWLQRVFMRKRRIIHYVGDPIDTIRNNNNFSLLKKCVYIFLFLPEHLLYLWASRGRVKVVTNGLHLAEKLKKSNVTAHPKISTTLSTEDFFFDATKVLSNITPKIIYIGYLRKAKGVDTVIEAFSVFKKTYPGAMLSIVGSGEMEAGLRDMVDKRSISDVTFHGHVDSRKQLNSLLRSSDVFCFASLSEGSPRVIMEAMANGLNVVSTPVGSLPYMFEDEKDILYAGFNNAAHFASQLVRLISNPCFSYNLRSSSFDKVQGMTLDKFIDEVFNDS